MPSIKRMDIVRKKKVKKIEIEGGKSRGGHVTLHCNTCHKDYDVRTNNPELYTEEIRKKNVCLLCKSSKRED